jgi:hypothetical protein
MAMLAFVGRGGLLRDEAKTTARGSFPYRLARGWYAPGQPADAIAPWDGLPIRPTVTASVVVIFGRLILVVLPFLGSGRTGNRILAVDPPAQVDEPASFSAERKVRKGVDRGDPIRFGTGWAASRDHVSFFGEGEGAGVGLAGSLFDALEESVDDLDSPAALTGSLEDLSAFSAFL